MCEGKNLLPVFPGLPLAAGVGAPWGLWLPPSFCGSAMAFSSVLVAAWRSGGFKNPSNNGELKWARV